MHQQEFDRICTDLAAYTHLVATGEWSVFEDAPTRIRRARWDARTLAQPIALVSAAAIVLAFQGKGSVQTAGTLLVAAVLSSGIFTTDTRSTIVNAVRSTDGRG
jgi:hypothetical protein